jgi:DHA1 family bicyclomycin/chloramphenicol resistance-like MFS transporter
MSEVRAISADPPLRLILILAGLAAFSPLSIDMYLPGLPSLMKDLGAGADAGQSTLSVFLLGLAAGQFFYGPLSDRFGRRPLLFAGAALYLAATVVCALAPNIETLIAARLAQALGGCAGVVISRAVIADLFKGEDAARALSLLMIVMGVAPIVAPILGASVLAAVGWRGIFWLQGAFAVAATIAAVVALPETRSPLIAARARLEGVVSAYAAVARNHGFLAFVLTAAFANGCLLSYVGAAPGLLEDWFGLNVHQVGLAFALTGGTIIAFNQVNRLLLRRFPSSTVLVGAVLWSTAASLLVLLVAATGWGGAVAWVAAVILAVLPFGLVQSNSAAAAFLLEPHRTGSAAAVIGASGYAAGALAGWCASALHDGSPLPVAAVMTVCLFGSGIALHLARSDPQSSVQNSA